MRLARKMLPYIKEYTLKEGKSPEKMQEIAPGRAFFRAMGYDDVKVDDAEAAPAVAQIQRKIQPLDTAAANGPICACLSSGRCIIKS